MVLKAFFYTGIVFSSIAVITLAFVSAENMVSLLSGYLDIVSVRGVLFLGAATVCSILSVYLLVRSFGLLSNGRSEAAVGMAWSPIALSVLVGILYLGTFAH